MKSIRYIGQNKPRKFAINDTTYSVDEDGKISPQPPQDLIDSFGPDYQVSESKPIASKKEDPSASKAKKPSEKKSGAKKKKS